MTERMRSQMQAAEMTFLCQGEKLSHPLRAQSRDGAPHHREELVEVAQGSSQDASLGRGEEDEHPFMGGCFLFLFISLFLLNHVGNLKEFHSLLH